VSVAEAFDAMTTDSAHRERRSTEDALSELRRGAGTQFDPRVVDSLERVIRSAAAEPQDAPQRVT
jgi:HD-GYP domain-containing protein (c-di-GMP phosphodiesterase class II)